MNAKKILVLCKEIPYPPHKNGVCSTIYNLICEWKKSGHTICIKYYTDQEVDNENEFLDMGVHVSCENAVGKEIFCRINDKYILKPRNSWSFDTRKISMIDAGDYDYIILSNLVTSTVIDKIVRKDNNRIVFFEADSLSMYYSRNAKNSKNIIKKLYCKAQELIVKNFEGQIYRSAYKTIFVSEVDRAYARAFCSEGDMETVKIAVKEYPEIKKHEISDICNIGFSGIMDYEPNILAVEYIINNIMPVLDSTGLSYRMHIIGKNPKKEWLDNAYYNEGKLVITGFLDDIESYISQMDIYISPLFLGSGMKNKILQAMAIGVPLIASKVSVEGIDELIDKENILLCNDDPQKWTELVSKLYSDKQLRLSFTEKCRNIIKQNYSWSNVAKKMIGD